jgi:hypothetical protein
MTLSFVQEKAELLLHTGFLPNNSSGERKKNFFFHPTE